MPILSPQDHQALQERFRKDLKRRVTLKLFSQSTSRLFVPGRECPSCLQTQQLLEELSSTSPLLELETIDFYNHPEVAREYGVERIPATVITRGQASGVKFYGLPSGYEFVTMIEGIIATSQARPPLSADTRKRLRLVDQDVHIQVLVTPT